MFLAFKPREVQVEQQDQEPDAGVCVCAFVCVSVCARACVCFDSRPHMFFRPHRARIEAFRGRPLATLTVVAGTRPCGSDLQI